MTSPVAKAVALFSVLQHGRRFRKEPVTADATTVGRGLLSTTNVQGLARTATLLSDGAGSQDWSHALNLIAYDRRDEDGTRRLYTCAPDGSNTRLYRVPDDQAKHGLRTDRHTVAPTWHPSGEWLVCQVENEWHPLIWWRTSGWIAELVINGMACELYAVSRDGRRWHRLTHSSWPDTYGHMSQHFDPRTGRIAWAKMVAPAGGNLPWGRWRLMLADFVNDPATGVPVLHNVQDKTPADAIFVEPHAFHPYENWLLYSTYDPGGDHNRYFIAELDLNTGKSRVVTHSIYWDEHASYSPDGTKIAYLAGELGIWPLTADMMLMDYNTGVKQRLTAFNHWGQPGYTEGLTMVMRASWHKDGTKIAVSEQMHRGYPGRRRLWVIDLGDGGVS